MKTSINQETGKLSEWITTTLVEVRYVEKAVRFKIKQLRVSGSELGLRS